MPFHIRPFLMLPLASWFLITLLVLSSDLRMRSGWQLLPPRLGVAILLMPIPTLFAAKGIWQRYGS